MILYIIIFFCSAQSINTMQSEDYYDDFPPQLYTNQDGINNTTIINQWNTPFINTISISNKLEPKDYFSICLFKYQDSFPLFDKEDEKITVEYDNGIKNSIKENSDQIVMAQKKERENIIFIPIQQTEQDYVAEEHSSILALALMAGNAHFKMKQAQITVTDNDFVIWKKLFQNFGQSKNQFLAEQPHIYFSLNFIASNIDKIIQLIGLFRDNFNTEQIKAHLSKYSKKEQPDQLNLFLSTGEFEEENISEQENRSNNFYQTIYKYLTFKKVKDTLHQNFFRPIHNWYNYFTRSIRFWKNLFGY